MIFRSCGFWVGVLLKKSFLAIKMEISWTVDEAEPVFLFFQKKYFWR
jgi:hypothetical protein